jgi:hypothetical protein
MSQPKLRANVATFGTDEVLLIPVAEMIAMITGALSLLEQQVESGGTSTNYTRGMKDSLTMIGDWLASMIHDVK